MTTRTWVAGRHSGYYAFNADAWSPAGVPQPGDYLQMVSGVMTLRNYDLAGNELHLGNGQTDAGNSMINLYDGSNLTANAVGGFLNFGDNLRINVSGTNNHLTADNLEAVQGTVSLLAHSNLVVTGNLQFAYFGDILGPGTLTNNGFISIAQGGVSAHVNGHGTLQLHAYHSGTGIQTITGAIDAGQDVQLTSGASGGTRTELVNPSTFKGTVDVAPASIGHYTNLLEVDGIHASRMDIRGDMLRLYGTGNKPLWQVHEHMPAGYTASMSATAGGTEIMFAPSHQLVG